MKNKKLMVLLIVSVTAVWGVIFYRIFAATTSEGELLKKSYVSFNEPIAESYIAVDTFTLALDYRDPFLDKVEEIAPESDATVAEPVAAPPAPPQINWEFIKYNGHITNPVTGKIVSIVMVNGKEQMLEDGQAITGVKLIKNYRDSIKVAFQNQTKFISLP